MTMDEAEAARRGNDTTAAGGGGVSNGSELAGMSFAERMATAESGLHMVSDRVKTLAASLSQLPELTLEETARVQQCFTNVMGEKESITNSFELRVVLSDLGLNPAEDELALLLSAFRGKLNMASLCRCLRFYKKEFQTHDFATVQSPPPSFDASHAAGAGMGDADTLKAFVALGGEEDGSGEVSTAALLDTIKAFGLTIDMDAMVASVDVHHAGLLNYADFCALWYAANGELRRGSVMSFSALNATSPSSTVFAGKWSNPRSTRSGTHGRRGSTTKSSAMKHGHNNNNNNSTEAGERNYNASNNNNNFAGARAGSAYSSVLGAASPGANFASHAMSGVGNTNITSVNVPRSVGGVIHNASSAAMAAMMNSNTPMTEQDQFHAAVSAEEHLQLLYMYLFPEKFESTRRAHFETNAFGAGGSNAAMGGGGGGGGGGGAMGGGCMGGGGTGGAMSAANSRLPSLVSGAAGAGAGGQRGMFGRSSRARVASVPRGTARLPSMARGEGRRGGNASTRRRADEGGNEEDDFIAHRSGGVYRPPSPMILTLRNNTTYKSRLQHGAMSRTAAAATAPPSFSRASSKY